MGTPLQEVDVIYDTGSQWLTVDTDLCDTCMDLDETYFKTEDSTSYVLYDSDLGEDGTQNSTII